MCGSSGKNAVPRDDAALGLGRSVSLSRSAFYRESDVLGISRSAMVSLIVTCVTDWEHNIALPWKATLKPTLPNAEELREMNGFLDLN